MYYNVALGSQSPVQAATVRRPRSDPNTDLAASQAGLPVPLHIRNSNSKGDTTDRLVSPAIDPKAARGAAPWARNRQPPVPIDRRVTGGSGGFHQARKRPGAPPRSSDGRSDRRDRPCPSWGRGDAPALKVICAAPALLRQCGPTNRGISREAFRLQSELAWSFQWGYPSLETGGVYRVSVRGKSRCHRDASSVRDARVSPGVGSFGLLVSSNPAARAPRPEQRRFAGHGSSTFGGGSNEKPSKHKSASDAEAKSAAWGRSLAPTPRPTAGSPLIGPEFVQSNLFDGGRSNAWF